MRRLDGIDAVRAWRRALASRSVGFVPTLGGLHAGHLSLVRRAIEENERAVVSIFLNPTQFGEATDLASYPRQLERDCELLEEVGCDAVYCPSTEQIYPAEFQSWVDVGGVALPLEGAARPGHFRGVATVVVKLLNQVRPDRAYFGEKDAQQVVVIETVVRDLDLDVEIVRCPTVREPDGLALSTRNRLLDPEQRAAASVLWRALGAAREAYAEGERDPAVLRDRVVWHLALEPRAAIDYVSAADPVSLTELPADQPAERVLVSLAVRFGGVRLIDNLFLGVS